MSKAVIVSAVRTPMGRAPRGNFKDVRPDTLGAIAVKGLLDRVPQLPKEEVEDLIMGNAFPELEQGYNIARTIGVMAGLPNTVAGMTINRFCSSGLQAVALGCAAVEKGWADVVIAGGVESMSTIPLGGMKICPNPELLASYPEYYLNMGLTAEEVATRYGITREMQDEFALSSFAKAETSVKSGRFNDEIVPVEVTVKGQKKVFSTDELKAGVTRDFVINSKPVFKLNGTVTPQNASQTTDGASAVLIMSEEKAAKYGLKPMAVLKAFAVTGCDPDIMGIGPIYAIPKALKTAGLKLEDIELFELNEAFAAQALAVMKTLGLNQDIVNVNGGAIALGHPLGASGAKLSTTLLYEMGKRNLRYGIVSMCIGGGMGAAGVFERL